MKLFTLNISFITFILGSMLSQNIWANNSSGNGGFIGGGGGSGIKVEEKLYLLDLYEFDKNQIGTKIQGTLNKLIFPKIQEETTSTLEVPLYNKERQIERIIDVSTLSRDDQSVLNKQLRESDPLLVTKNILSSYQVAMVLPLAISNTLEWSFTYKSPEQEQRFELSDNSKNVETIAYYIFQTNIDNTKSRKVLLSIPRWNRLDFTGQVGLIIHEILRDFQLAITSKNGRGFEFNELVLQRTTALVTMCEPNDYLIQFITRYLSNYNGKLGGIEGLGVGFSYEEALRQCKRVDL